MILQLIIFVIRWFANSFGIWIAITFLGQPNNMPESSVGIILIAGLVFSVVNSLFRPIAIIISLPAILLTLGLFTLVVNGFIVWLSLLFVPHIGLSFWDSILAGIILGIINYVISSILELSVRRLERR